MMSRTGLLSLAIFCLSISLVASAPLPELGSNLVERSYDYESDDIFERSPALFDRELEIEDEYIARDEFDDFDLESRGFFKHLGHDLAKAGKGLAKVDLRVASAASGAVAKATKFIPGVGRGAGLAAKAESRLTNAAANAIHRRGFFSKLKHAFQKIGHGIAKAAKAVVKFDLKAMSKVSGVVGKVGKFIPGVSTAATTFAKVESKVTGAVAKKIH
ncbi:hypothetical protein GALMADRAFT_253314 [Galerina marginata CBS 339.88]|uniref:Uncharacterized protein n=1 Tax=Galerina marginata (strain CBS 339.88) TaxID=685588 RepID=A0A067SPS0_GALM3|nr:hypothetical protein GALMADRAFT_253314 [Galerina marginata CBS 339.88]